jgi:hypothetical protein
MAALGALMAVVYWFVSYEAAGSVLLAGFGLACGIIGVRAGAGGTARMDADRPLLDEHGRIPSPTFGPFALAVGIALAATSLVFGLAPLVVAVLPVAWGAREWLGRASAELDATDADEA